MQLVRNSINIAGLSDTSELSERINVQTIQFAEIDTIHIPVNQPEILSIYEVILKVDAKEGRKICTPNGCTFILDGNKKIKIIYKQCEESGQANFLELVLPFNTHIVMSTDTHINGVNVHILDAYFDLLDHRKLYSHILYLVEVTTKAFPMKQFMQKQEIHQTSIQRQLSVYDIYSKRESNNVSEIIQFNQNVNDDSGINIMVDEDYDPWLESEYL